MTRGVFLSRDEARKLSSLLAELSWNSKELRHHLTEADLREDIAFEAREAFEWAMFLDDRSHSFPA
jgi:hypothetical protein